MITIQCVGRPRWVQYQVVLGAGLWISDNLQHTWFTSWRRWCTSPITALIMLLQEELQISHGAREKELNKQRAVDRARVRDPSNRQKIVSLFGILDWFLDVLGFPQLYSWSLSTTAYCDVMVNYDQCRLYLISWSHLSCSCVIHSTCTTLGVA